MVGKDLIMATLFGSGGGSSGGGSSGGGGISMGTVTVTEDVRLSDTSKLPIVTHNLGREINGIATFVESVPITSSGDFKYATQAYANLATKTMYVQYLLAYNGTNFAIINEQSTNALHRANVEVDDNSCVIPMSPTVTSGKWVAGTTVRWFVW